MAGLALTAGMFLWGLPGSFHLTGVFILFLWAWFWMAPRINHYRDSQLNGDKKAGKSFNTLHRLSVGVHLAKMGIIGYVLYQILAQA